MLQNANCLQNAHLWSAPNDLSDLNLENTYGSMIIRHGKDLRLSSHYLVSTALSLDRLLLTNLLLQRTVWRISRSLLLRALPYKRDLLKKINLITCICTFNLTCIFPFNTRHVLSFRKTYIYSASSTTYGQPWDFDIVLYKHSSFQRFRITRAFLQHFLHKFNPLEYV